MNILKKKKHTHTQERCNRHKRMCEQLCVCERERERERVRYIYIYIYIYIYRERERERERERGRGGLTTDFSSTSRRDKASIGQSYELV